MKKNKFPITGRDWLALIRNLPGGCAWIVIALLVLAIIKLAFFPE